MMDKENIESLSINEVERYFSRTDTIVPELNKKDRKPLYDGFLRLYSGKSHDNSTYIGDIPVQVKGHEKSSHSDTVSHRISKKDLTTYNRNGGLFYFVVYLGSRESSAKIYYAELNQLYIKKYIADNENNDSKTISLTLHALPTDKKIIEKQLAKFYYDKIYLSTSYDKPIVSIDDYLASSGDKCFVIKPNASGSFEDLCKSTLLEENIIYAADRQRNILFPIGDRRYKLAYVDKIEQAISINGKKYFDYYSVIYKDNTIEVTIGGFLSCKIFLDDKQRQLTYTSKGILVRERKLEFEFILGVHKHKSLFFGENEFSCPEFSLPEETLRLMTSELEVLNIVSSLFDKLHIDEDIDITKLSNEERMSLNWLNDCIVSNKHIRALTPGNNPETIKIGELKIYVVYCFVSEGVYHIEDFFTSPHVKCLTGNNGEIETSRFYSLSVQDFVEISNIDFDSILYSYQILKEKNPEIYIDAYLTMQRLILAYDLSGQQKSKLLSSAKNIVSWLMKLEPFGKGVILDYYQIIKRERSLSDKEKSIIYDIEDSIDNIADKVTCNLLLDNQINAQRLLNKMSKEDLLLFYELPITHFLER